MNKLAFYSLLIIIFLGCEYSPSGSNYIESNTELDGIDFSISIPSAEIIDETLKVGGIINIDYEIDIGDKRLEKVEAWIDDDTLNNLWANNVYLNLTESVPLNTQLFVDGMHSLNFRVTTNSGRDNILDKLGGEQLESFYTMHFYIDNAPPKGVQITSIENSGGELLINFEKSLSYNFDHYLLFKQGGNLPNRIYSITNSPIHDRSNVTISDTNYVGGRYEYFVRVAGDQEFNNGEKVVFEDDYPRIISADTTDKQVTLTWTKCRYPQNFNFYRVRSDWNLEFFISDINDTTLTFSYASFPNLTILDLLTSGTASSSFDGAKTRDIYYF